MIVGSVFLAYFVSGIGQVRIAFITNFYVGFLYTKFKYKMKRQSTTGLSRMLKRMLRRSSKNLLFI